MGDEVTGDRKQHCETKNSQV